MSESHQLFLSLAKEYPLFGNEKSSKTLFTEEQNEEILWRKDRPGLIVSSTSWTEDEDFTILLNALQGTLNILISMRKVKYIYN